MWCRWTECTTSISPTPHLRWIALIWSLRPRPSAWLWGIEIAVVLALVAALGYGSGDFLGGAATRKMPAVRTLLWAHGIGFLVLIPWVARSADAPVIFDMVAGAGAGLFGLCGLIFLYTGLARGRAAIVAPAAAVVGAVVPVTAGLVAGEGCLLYTSPSPRD